MRLLRLLIVVMVGALSVNALADEVRVYEEPLTLPTYKPRPPEIMPRWRDRVYPYTMLDKLSSEKTDVTYKALYVENEYVKALVLPEIGGRLHGAEDKTNGYQFLYDQTTIKPGLVGLTGAWISGGVEWNFPDGHRASGFRDTDYRLQENPDGSKTAWTGEIDKITGMRWAIGTTVYPGRNWVETRVRLYNCTPYVQNFQYWATSGVRATMEYQAVIPGEIVTGHGKHSFYRWPVHEGVDLTYWKNIAPASSFFAWESQDDYFGGYSPENDAGMVHVADHHIVRGKKLWTWGTAPSGRIWEDILTDDDLPYFEPQAGGYSDNQPDLHWIRPGETKVFSHYWIPVRDIGVYDYANLEGALNIELDGRDVRFGWSATGVNENARVVLTSDGNEIFSETVDADPANPFVAEAKAPRGADLYSLRMTVIASSGDTLLSYSHPKPENPPLPEPESRYPSPSEVESLDRLFVIGDHYYRFRSPERGMMYFEEALERDPGDVRCNTSVGEILLKRGRFGKALEHFERSIERDVSYYKAWYYKGMAQLRLGEPEKAEASLNRASYDLAWYAASHYKLAQIVAARGDYEKALEHIERSIRGNGDNAQAYAVKALILNRMGRFEDALAVAEMIQEVDPLDFLSLTEEYFSLKNLGREARASEAYSQAMKLSRMDSHNFLELAIRYERCGQYDHALKVLSILDEQVDGIDPMAHYYMAWYKHLLGNEQAAASRLEKASSVDATYSFPSRLESIPVLSWAIESNADDAQAHYLMGNLLYSLKQPDNAIASWESSVALNDDNAVALRNLAYAYHHDRKDPARARTVYEQAMEAGPGSPVVVYELSTVYRDLGVPTGDIIAMLENHIDATTSYDPALTRLISSYVQVGRYEDALKWLGEHHFHSWEGRYGIHQYWVESNIKLGDRHFEDGEYQQALEHYQSSLEYPPNLEVAAQPRVVHARKLFKVAQALEKLGRDKEARETYLKVVEEKDKMRPDNAYQYFLGRALDKLGREDEAGDVYNRMLAALEQAPAHDDHEDEENPHREDSGNPEALKLFKRSLALEGLGRVSEAEQYRDRALDMDPIVALRAFSPPRAGW